MIDCASIAVVVPALDEARWIGDVVATMPGFVDWLVVVDDHSRDDTLAVARAARRRDQALLLEHHPARRGVGAAIVSGYRRALDAGADVIAVMAGDGQMHPGDLEQVVRPVVSGRFDYVKGNRLLHPEVWSAMPWERLVGTAAFGWLTSRAIGVPLGDSQCGFTAASRSALERLDLDRIWPSYGYPNDLLAALACAGLRIGEVPVRPVYRGEASGLRLWHATTIAALVVKAAWRARLGQPWRA